MSKKVFRQKSIDEFKKPDNLSDYIKVTNLRLWLIIAFIIILLAGFVIWGSVGTINTKTNVYAVVIDKEITCCVDKDIYENVESKLKKNEEVKFEMNGVIGKITQADEDNTLIGTIDLNDTMGEAVIYESFSPISLLFD